MAEADPDQEAALRRLRAAFGFVEVLRIIDHQAGHDQGTASWMRMVSRHRLLRSERQGQ